MSNLKDILYNKIEEWVCEQAWDDKEEVAGAIALTNAIFDEVYCESINIKKKKRDEYYFTAMITMYGEPRGDDVSFCGDTINIQVKGTVIFNIDKKDELEISCDRIIAQVEDWSDKEEIFPFPVKTREISVSNIDKLFNILSKFPPHFWFRGQLDESWALKPSIARIEKPSLPVEKELRAEFQNQTTFLNTFGSLSNIENTTFLMQHHKVPTRLLDWTTSPLIALYFSIYEMNYTKHSNDKNSCIWVLDPKSLNNTYKKEKIKEDTLNCISPSIANAAMRESLSSSSCSPCVIAIAPTKTIIIEFIIYVIKRAVKLLIVMPSFYVYFHLRIVLPIVNPCHILTFRF